MEHVGRPSIKRIAADFIPRLPLPAAKTDFAEARVDTRHNTAGSA